MKQELIVRAVIMAIIWLLALMAILVIIALLPAPAHAQLVCAKARDMAAGLLAKYHEEIVFTGTMYQNTGQLIVMAGPSGSFSIMIVRGDGVACLMATGEDAESSKYVRGEKS